MAEYQQAASKVERIIQKADAVGLKVELENPDVLLELDQDISKVHVIGMFLWPGVELFATRLEHEHFNPLTDRESLLELRHIEWMGLLFMMITIPFQDWKLIHRTAEAVGLRVSTGIPMVINCNDYFCFPMRSFRIRSLEYCGSPFRWGSDQHRDVLRMENLECDKIRERTHQQYLSQCMVNN
jgi:hypothetical protein